MPTTLALPLQLNLTQLRKGAAIRGLVNDGVSRRPGRGERAAHISAAVEAPTPLPPLNRCQPWTHPACAALASSVQCHCFGILAHALQLRARVWPLLLGVEVPGAARQPEQQREQQRVQWEQQQQYEEGHGSTHKDSHVVQCDMTRSLWTFTEGDGCCNCRAICIHSVPRNAMPAWHACMHGCCTGAVEHN